MVQLPHRLWSKVTRNPDYIKSEGMEVERILVQCAAKLQNKKNEVHQPRP